MPHVVLAEIASSLVHSIIIPIQCKESEDYNMQDVARAVVLVWDVDSYCSE